MFFRFNTKAIKVNPAFACRFFVFIFACLSLTACGEYIDAVEESLAGSIKFSSIRVSTSGAQARMASDTERMAKVAPAVKAALETSLRDRLRPSDANAYPL